MIELHNVSKTYSLSREQTVQAVRNVTLTAQRGEFVVITGRSGSGKTTLLNLAAGLTRPTAGAVTLDGTDLWTISERQRSLLRSQKLGFIFQFPSLLPSLTALEYVILPTIFRTDQVLANPAQRATELLESVGLADKLASYPRQLSAGQQQCVVDARALMNQPEILLADEPTSDLDEQTEQEIMDIFRDIHAQMGVTIALVTHTRQLVRYGTRSIEMARGEITTS